MPGLVVTKWSVEKETERDRQMQYVQVEHEVACRQRNGECDRQMQHVEAEGVGFVVTKWPVETETESDGQMQYFQVGGVGA